jgi:hypothetical protein
MREQVNCPIFGHFDTIGRPIRPPIAGTARIADRHSTIVDAQLMCKARIRL